MSLLTGLPLAEVPLADGLRVFLYGFSGVFLALALLAAGVKVISLVVEKTEAKESDKA